MYWIIAVLICLGILFLLIETLITPGFGVAGILGLAALAGACGYTFIEIGTTAGLIVTSVLLLAVVALLVVVLRSKTWKRLELNTVIDSKVNKEAEAVKVGQTGTALTRLAPMGTVQFPGITCEAKSSDNTLIDAGTEVEAVALDGNKVIVKPTNKE